MVWVSVSRLFSKVSTVIVGRMMLHCALSIDDKSSAAEMSSGCGDNGFYYSLPQICINMLCIV